MSILSISKLGHSVLREVSKAVGDVADLAVQALIDDMVLACQKANGIGLAAPQVSHSLRMFIMESRPGRTYPDAPLLEPFAVINPTILTTSEELVTEIESCLSIPGVSGPVTRHKRITVSFTNRSGEREERTFEGLPARVFQHEYDHTNGILFIDRVDPKELIIDEGFEGSIAARKDIRNRPVD